MAGFHSTGMGLGLQRKDTHRDLKCKEQCEPYFKSNSTFKMSKSSDSSRHPDGIGADTGCILDVVLIEAFLRSRPSEHI